jgi:hypothetical protein
MNSTKKPDAFEPSKSRPDLAEKAFFFFDVESKLKQKAGRQQVTRQGHQIIRIYNQA